MSKPVVSRASSSDDAYEDDSSLSRDEAEINDQKVDNIVQSVSSNSSTEDSSGKNATFTKVKERAGLQVDTSMPKDDM